MKDWLQTFASHVDIQLTIFIIAGAVTTSIALFTVGFQALKAAFANPVESLKSE